MRGTLYLVSLPIGNRDDITYRAVHVLKTVGLIVAEDAGALGPLRAHYGIQTPVTSYHTPGLAEKVAVILNRLHEGVSIALAADAGTPVICDPGRRLVQAALEAGIAVVPVPGPSAAVAAVPATGFASDGFFFYGRVPTRRSAQTRVFQALRDCPGTLVFFVDPETARRTLDVLRTILGNRRVALALELTKPNELFMRGRVDQVLHALDRLTLHGELTLLVEGRRGMKRRPGRAKRR